jgi:hypothetical protein
MANTQKPQYLVLRHIDYDPPEVYPFVDLTEAEQFYEQASAQWSDVFLLRIMRGPADVCSPEWTEPLSERERQHIRAEIGAVEGMLATTPEESVLDRVGLESRLEVLREELAGLGDGPVGERRACVRMMVGGKVTDIEVGGSRKAAEICADITRLTGIHATPYVAPYIHPCRHVSIKMGDDTISFDIETSDSFDVIIEKMRAAAWSQR